MAQSLPVRGCVCRIVASPTHRVNEVPEQPYTQRMTSTPLKELIVRVYPGEDGKTGHYALYDRRRDLAGVYAWPACSH